MEWKSCFVHAMRYFIAISNQFSIFNLDWFEKKLPKIQFQTNDDNVNYYYWLCLIHLYRLVIEAFLGVLRAQESKKCMLPTDSIHSFDSTDYYFLFARTIWLMLMCINSTIHSQYWSLFSSIRPISNSIIQIFCGVATSTYTFFLLFIFVFTPLDNFLSSLHSLLCWKSLRDLSMTNNY